MGRNKQKSVKNRVKYGYNNKTANKGSITSYNSEKKLKRQKKNLNLIVKLKNI